ncbi:UDP-N-acetylmuramoyl-tripeptide--D-alanyl-D-alanine ligase [Auritidibacter sp. NML120779]|nr:UDP-N-acetylmuramoyl-tripeptide--D-alanyl-D-alanine ligase [Auritidibacter sp. NML120779]
MIELTAAQIADATGGQLVAGTDPDTSVNSATTDSREITAGGLFVAKPGEFADGHDFVLSARERGAKLMLGQREVSDDNGTPVPGIIVADTVVAMGDLAEYIVARIREHSPTTVIGITGSVGKTTTKDLLAGLLSEAVASDDPDAVIAPQNSYNGEVGVPLTIFRASLTTRYLVVEMGADHVGNIADLCRMVRPDISVALTVGSAHTASFGSVENIVKTKGEIVEGLSQGGVAVLNADDPRVTSMAERVPEGAEVLWFSTANRHDSAYAPIVYTAELSTDDNERPHFYLGYNPTGRPADLQLTAAEVTSGLTGIHHATNLAATAAVAVAAGLDPETVGGLLHGRGPVSKHRMARTDRADGITIIDDSYNANPESMRAGLKTLALTGRSTGRRTWAVLGEMLELGSNSIKEHIHIGEAVVRLNISQLVVVGQQARPLYTGAVMEGSWGDEVDHVADIDEAEQLLNQRLQPGDIVFIKGSNSTGLWKLADRLTADPTTPRQGDLQ